MSRIDAGPEHGPPNGNKEVAALVCATAAWSPALAQQGQPQPTPGMGQPYRETRAESTLALQMIARPSTLPATSCRRCDTSSSV